MASFPIPSPLLDTVAQISINPPDAKKILFKEDWNNVLTFLKQYDGNEQTFNAYRRELERLLQWSWLIAKKSILTFGREDIESYLKFCLKPPKSWIGIKNVYRFIEKEGKRVPNSVWRPFVASVTKAEHKQGVAPDKADYHLSPKAMREIFTVLNSFYNTLVVNEKIPRNPIMLIKQKSRYIQKQQKEKQILRLTDEQWGTCIKKTRELAENNEIYHRVLFIISAMYLMYLRISEFAATTQWTPQMNHFYQDSEKDWWFKTVGKGNKLRTIAVGRAMLEALKQYRRSLNLSPLPSPADNSPLIPKIKGQGAIANTRHIRSLIQHCFDLTEENLKQQGKIDEAHSLSAATVHWLRHTGISDDINKRSRPLAHVRDDAGHSSAATTDRYNDVELKKRHASAAEKKLLQIDFN